MISAPAFLLIAGSVLVASLALGLVCRPAPAPPPAPGKEEPSRWAVYRLHLDRLLDRGSPIVEAVGGGPLLVVRRAGGGRRPRIEARDASGKRRVAVRPLRAFRRRAVRVLLDGRPIADLRGGRSTLLEEVRPRDIDFTVAGDAGALEAEARRGGKLLAAMSPEIAPAPSCAGIEVLAAADPLPVISVFLGIAILWSLAIPVAAAGEKDSDRAPEIVPAPDAA